MRLSQENEDCQRASNHQSSAPKRSQTTLRLTFPKSARLTTRDEFRRVQREGKRTQGQYLILTCMIKDFTCQRPCQRLGESVSKQFGSAVKRNLFKRRVREAFRAEKHRLPPGISVHISPRNGMGMPTLAHIKADFKLIYAQ